MEWSKDSVNIHVCCGEEATTNVVMMMRSILCLALVGFSLLVVANAGFTVDVVEICGHGYNVSHIMKAFGNDTLLASLTMPLLERRNVISMPMSERMGHYITLAGALGWQDANCTFVAERGPAYIQKLVETVLILMAASS